MTMIQLIYIHEYNQLISNSILCNKKRIYNLNMYYFYILYFLIDINYNSLAQSECHCGTIKPPPLIPPNYP